MKCVNLHTKVNYFGDKTSSIKIEHKKTGAAKGFWKNVGSATGKYNFELKVGLTNTREVESSATITNTLTIEGEAGIRFAGALVTNELSMTVMAATKNTFATQTLTTVSFECKSPNYE